MLLINSNLKMYYLCDRKYFMDSGDRIVGKRYFKVGGRQERFWIIFFWFVLRDFVIGI